MREWSNLPSDLLDLIFRKLYFTDRIRFRTVCKDWFVPIGNRPINEIPWIMSYTPSLFNYPSKETKIMLSDPVYKRTYTMPNFPGIQGENMEDDLSVFASKGGWLLLRRVFGTGNAIYLYSPFTNKVIALPRISCGIKPISEKATFSSTNPMSPDCVFVIAHWHWCNKASLGISTYRNGDIEWRTKFLSGGFNHEVSSLVCIDKGVCYILFQSGSLGAFCVESQEWSWLVDSFLTVIDHELHLVELNGVWLLVNRTMMRFSFDFFRYDEDERGWIQQKNLGDRVLFIGVRYNSFLRPAIGDTADLANKILYRTCDGRIYNYSLKDDNSSRKAYDWIVKDSSLHRIWIEPPY